MIYLGVDPGYADAGYGVISVEGGKDSCLVYGSIKTPAGAPMAERLAALFDELDRVITTYRPQKAAIEKLFFSTNVKTAISVAEARGVIRLCLAKRQMPCHEFNPAEVKIAVCGNGRAEKMQVQEMIKKLLKLDKIPQPDDAADALAIALALAHTMVLQ